MADRAPTEPGERSYAQQELAKAAEGTGFYVGYLGMPPALARRLRWLVPAAVWLLALLAGLLSWSQPSPGDGVWHNALPERYQGILVFWPFPILVIESHRSLGPFLLVEVGKHGVNRDLKEFEGTSVEVSGWLLEREGRQVIELEPDSAGLHSIPPSGIVIPPIMDRGHIVLRGEIVDSKCYTGAMKPGEGVTHKSCATLCIKGGIPPMLVSHSADGRAIFTLVCDKDGRPLGSELWQFIAEPVRVTGHLQEVQGLRRICVDTGGIMPL